jgi:hypothetical protein
VEPLGLGPAVLGTALLPQRLQHRRRALGDEVAGDPAGAVQGGVDLEVPVAVPAVVVAGAVVVR